MTNVQANLAQDLLRIHRAITRGLNVGLEKGAQYEQTGFPNPETRKGYTDYALALTLVLSSHHLGEDEVAFPAIRERLPAAPYEKLAADHHTIDRLLERFKPAVTQAAAGDGAALHQLVDVLRSVNALWAPHIHIEETSFSPQALGAVMGMDEQARLGGLISKHSAEHSDPAYLTLPFVLYNLAPEDRAVLASTMPPMLVQELIPKAWKDLWAPMKPFLLE